MRPGARRRGLIRPASAGRQAWDARVWTGAVRQRAARVPRRRNAPENDLLDRLRTGHGSGSGRLRRLGRTRRRAAATTARRRAARLGRTGRALHERATLEDDALVDLEARRGDVALHPARRVDLD